MRSLLHLNSSLSEGILPPFLQENFPKNDNQGVLNMAKAPDALSEVVYWENNILSEMFLKNFPTMGAVI